jgi:hypothetical protein
MAGLENRDQEWWSWWRADGQDQVAHLLREHWNPMGDVPEDEYAGYATRVGGLLREGVSEDELTAFLDDARKGAMGLPAEPDTDRRAAAMVRDWYAGARPNLEP